jgi:EmrB/QacA subfamily drug resistance transporter
MTQKHTGSWAVVVAVALGTFMTSMDINVVNISLPLIQKSFHTGISSVQWIAVAYLLALCSTQLTFGKLADIYSLKKFYVFGSIGFTLSSLLCGISWSIEMLILFRVLQALFGAMMISTSSAIITNAVSPENRGKALSSTAISVAVSTLIGPVLGGFLAESFGWSSIFFINIPIGIVGTILAVRAIPDYAAKPGKKFDLVGSVLIVLALTLLLMPLEFLGQVSIQPAWLVTSLVAGLVLLASFLLHESRSAEPILNLNLFRNRVFAAGNFAATLFFIFEFMLVFFLPYYLQQQRMLSASVAGLIMLPMPLAMMLAAPIGGSLSDKLDSRLIVSVGLGLTSAGALFFGTFGADTPIYLLLIVFVVTGIGVGFFQTPNNSAVMGNVEPENRGIGGATLSTMRNTGMVLGEAIAAAMFSFNYNRATLKYTAQGFQGLALRQAAFGEVMWIICITAACFSLAALGLSLIRGKAQRGKFTGPETVFDDDQA